MHGLLRILGRPDDLPIVLMVPMFAVILGWWWRTARRNDRLLASGGEAEILRVMAGPPPPGGPSEDLPGGRVSTWPHLLRIELVGAMVVMVLLGAWTILVDAPLEQMADAGRTPNPSKAPWYFLGLQEMLVYFDPWIAGVTLPALIILGLCAIPYLDPNPAASGYLSFRPRRVALSIFLAGFYGLWLPLIAIGTFFRGPGWGFFWPWEPWDAAAVADRPTRDLAAVLGVGSPLGSQLVGAAALLLFFGGGFALAFSPRARASETFRRMGAARVAIAAFLLLAMLGLPIKILLRLTLDVKYVLLTRWFGI